MDSDWNTDTYRTVPQLEQGDKVETKELQPRNDDPKPKSPQGNMFVQSMFDMTLITVNFCQICYILKVGPALGWLYYLLLGLFGMSLRSAISLRHILPLKSYS
ncbi:AGAP002240-PA-like protein [Anopheles sinensis]|uniref:AGAP002240-PA-like protein n=1 Tax=Anopheles sinensis TaxID=74873 RepID=A0A084W2P1_ANOSI|nr:AGAP002240-PA-like protein [Anopheles sinensis]